jgi:hypothetical protein
MPDHHLETTSAELIQATGRNERQVYAWYHAFEAELEAQRNRLRPELLATLRAAATNCRVEHCRSNLSSGFPNIQREQ